MNNKLQKYDDILFNDSMLFELSVVPQMIVNKDRVILRINKKFSELFNYTAKEIIGKQTVVLTPSKEKFDEYEEYFSQTKDNIFKSEELEYKKSDKSLFWTKLEGIQIYDKDDDILILWSFINIDKEVKYREKLKKLASKDSLTGLYNRRYFTDMSSKILELARRNLHNTSIVMLDIDRFKNINDIYGHQVGDEVIVLISNLLKKNTRSSDINCRFGGEEFIILLPKTNILGALAIAEDLRALIEDSEIKLQNSEVVKFTSSFGVSEINLNSDKSIEDSIKRADKALYRAKNSGRNRVILEYYSSYM
jgi:diguanylate cyclase (GGDEF)-like protein/PAS domain S-box-containing protein